MSRCSDFSSAEAPPPVLTNALRLVPGPLLNFAQTDVTGNVGTFGGATDGNVWSQSWNLGFPPVATLSDLANAIATLSDGDIVAAVEAPWTGAEPSSVLEPGAIDVVPASPPQFYEGLYPP